MQAFTSLNSGRTMLATLRSSGWGLIASPYSIAKNRVPDGFVVALDNGAWSAFNSNISWSPSMFARSVEDYGRRVCWVACPDSVGNAEATWGLIRQWWWWCMDRARRVLVVVQDGMSYSRVSPLVGPRTGIFVGGTDAWKESTLLGWAELARRNQSYCHVGRVNSTRRTSMCINAGVDSIDGNSSIMFPTTHRKLDNARHQTSWLTRG